jgi:membrane protein DedA with SNARE-associated domain
MLLLDVSDSVAEIFGRFSYLAPFTVLLLCGLGLPLPEEVTLLGSGMLLHSGEVRFVPIVLVCSAAILLGDSVPFWLGRRYGLNALRIAWVRRYLHPERFSRLRRRFEEHGNWATFMCRFFAGVRIPGYFVAGTMGMSYPRFLILDSLGVLISVPLSIYLGKIFGESIDELEAKVRDIHRILAFLAVSLVLILVVRRRRHGRVTLPPRLPAAREESPRASASDSSHDPPGGA